MNRLENSIDALLVTFMMLLFSFTIYAQETYRDNFSSVSYSNNNGTLNFASDWVETNEGTNPNNGRIRINSNQLRFRNLDDRIIDRALDLSTAKTATLSLDYNRTNGNKTILVQLYDGTTFNTVATLAGGGASSISYSLTASEMSSSSAIRFRTGSGNWSSSETIFIDNVQFQVTLDLPPTVTATGNQNYCLGSTINIATSVSITDSDDTSTSAVYIQISSGYVNGEDLLTLDNLATHAANGITPVWDAVQGELTLSGPATYTDFEAVILDVLYSSSSGTATGVRQFSITVGEANFLPSTGHYYEYVPNLGITWSAANALANVRTHFGLQGYLATLTTLEEAVFSGTQALGTGWIGANDVSAEGQWRWVSGPEGLENAGLGRLFWQGVGTSGNTTAPDNFHYWRQTPGNEPNQAGNEDYAHIVHPSLSGTPGSWNDLPNTGSTNPASVYHPQGYVVEYGGTVGDPVLNITAITQVTLINTAAPTGTSPQNFCTIDSPTVADLAATGTGIQWYTNVTGGSPLAGTIALVDGTNYYASQTISGCESVTRLSVLVAVTDPVAPTTSGNQTECEQNPTQTLTATATAPSGSTVVWYDAFTGGNVVANPILNAVGSITYYAESLDGATSCVSAARTPVTLTVQACTSDLNLRKTVDNSSPNQGDTITFTITISNAGPSAPTNIVVKDIIPTDFTYTHPNFSTTQGVVTFNAGTREFEWDLGIFVLGVGNTITLTYSITVDVCGEFRNRAEIINSSLIDPDSTPNNGG